MPTKPKPVVTRIAQKYQVTVPVEMRDLFDLQEGDLLEWRFDKPAGAIQLIPKRPMLLTPQHKEEMAQARNEFLAEQEAAASENVKDAADGVKRTIIRS